MVLTIGRLQPNVTLTYKQNNLYAVAEYPHLVTCSNQTYPTGPERNENDD